MARAVVEVNDQSPDRSTHLYRPKQEIVPPRAVTEALLSQPAVLEDPIISTQTATRTGAGTYDITALRKQLEQRMEYSVKVTELPHDPALDPDESVPSYASSGVDGTTLDGQNESMRESERHQYPRDQLPASLLSTGNYGSPNVGQLLSEENDA